MAHEPHIPDRLNQALSRLHHADPPPLGGRDEELVAFASSRTRRPMLLRRPGIAIAAAAGLAIATTLAALYLPSGSGPSGLAKGDQGVTILDAYRLARQIESGAATLDLNRDGLSDQQDVDLLAMQAVSLTDGKRGSG